MVLEGRHQNLKIFVIKVSLSCFVLQLLLGKFSAK